MSATTTKEVYAGVDVSKGRLEVFVAPTGERFSSPNDEVGVEELLARLEESTPALVVLEATGGFERPVAAALVAVRPYLPLARPYNSPNTRSRMRTSTIKASAASA